MRLYCLILAQVSQILCIFAPILVKLMESTLKKSLERDIDGLLTYEYIANHIGSCDDIMDDLIDNMIEVDKNGQFTVSAARFLHAINPESYRTGIERLIAAAIDKDREHRYIGDLLQSIWGDDYQEHVEQLKALDNNFRRIYKRIYPHSSL